MTFWKTAFAVFIAILGAYCVVSYPRWMREYHADRREQALRDFARSLAPEDIISRCGKPDEDNRSLPDMRVMTYSVHDQQLFFVKTDGRWSLSASGDQVSTLLLRMPCAKAPGS